MTDNTILLTACTLARANRLDAAEELILSDPRLTRLPAALDLLARIRAHQGNLADARRLWNEILAIDPENKQAQAALKALDQRFHLAPRTVFISAAITVLLLITIPIVSCSMLKHRLNALEPESETEIITMPVEPVCDLPPAVLREFTSPSPNVDFTEIRPGTIRATITNMPTEADLNAVNELTATLPPLRHVLVTSTFFSQNAASRKILADFLCEGLKIPPTKLYIAADADTPGESIQIDLTEETEAPADIFTPAEPPPVMIDQQEFLFEPVDDDAIPAPAP